MNNPQGGGVDISSAPGKEGGVRSKLLRNIGKVKDKDPNADSMTYEDVTPIHSTAAERFMEAV